MHGEFSFSRLTYVTAAHCIVHDMTRQKCIPSSSSSSSHGLPWPTFKQRSQTIHLDEDQFGIWPLGLLIPNELSIGMNKVTITYCPDQGVRVDWYKAFSRAYTKTCRLSDRQSLAWTSCGGESKQLICRLVYPYSKAWIHIKFRKNVKVSSLRTRSIPVMPPHHQLSKTQAP